MRPGAVRDPALVLILSLITCGIYYLFWVSYVSGEIQDYLGEPDTSPGLEVLLFIVTCGLYTFYWDYKIAQKIARMQGSLGLRVVDNGTLYIVLNLIGVGMVNALIQQGHLNEIWQASRQRLPNGPYPSP
ncbi:MAG: DUF4234 domain-containing protein [Capsulimonadales bacterium]|nr:DUF4234 domain-containing protein [Capsulimonadales bacterium]